MEKRCISTYKGKRFRTGPTPTQGELERLYQAKYGNEVKSTPNLEKKEPFISSKKDGKKGKNKPDKTE